MSLQVLCAAMGSAIPNDDLSIESAELARADAEVLATVCHSEAELVDVRGNTRFPFAESAEPTART